MYTFKQFILEMPQKIDYGLDNRITDHTTVNPNTNDTFIGKTASGHHIYKRGGGLFNSRMYYALRPHHNPDIKTHKDVDMYVAGRHNKDTGHFSVDVLQGRKGSTLKAHEFYHHIAKHDTPIESSSKHSVGGERVWEKLSKYPDLEMSHHTINYETGKYRKIALHSTWHKNYGKKSVFRIRKKD